MKEIIELNERKIVIVDYGLGNLFSVEQACRKVGINPVLSHDKKVIESADGIILPGVGAFGDAMNNLKQLDLIEPLKDFISRNKPFLGVCLGMQLLFEESEEFGSHKGLGIIKGTIKKFPEVFNEKKNRIPQIEWNYIEQPQDNSWLHTPLKNIKNHELMYFVHSYYAEPALTENILSYTLYNDFKYCSSVCNGNVYGMQFHPEKSAAEGLKIYKNFNDLI